MHEIIKKAGFFASFLCFNHIYAWLFLAKSLSWNFI